MNEYLYQKQVIAYHGCDQSTVEKVLSQGKSLEPSEQAHDWLGKGIYFWEYGLQRARDWAEKREQAGLLKNPAVLGAVLHLGNCFDLLDTRYTDVLQRAWPLFVEAKKANSERVPSNRSPKNRPHKDKLLRFRDCAVINWVISEMEKTDNKQFDAVRGVFQEDELVFEDSGIHLKSHIQIAVRNPACIVGFFRPA